MDAILMLPYAHESQKVCCFPIRVCDPGIKTSLDWGSVMLPGESNLCFYRGNSYQLLPNNKKTTHHLDKACDLDLIGGPGWSRTIDQAIMSRLSILCATRVQPQENVGQAPVETMVTMDDMDVFTVILWTI
jgi:hypothetical protein